jgi:hypothetical protein
MAVLDDVIERVRGLPQQQLHALLEILDQPADAASTIAAPATHRLPGLPDIHPDDLGGALLRNRARLWRAREDLYATGLSRDEAAERLGVKPNQITNLLADTKLLALDGAEGLRLPAWQFDPNARRGRLDGIDRVAAVFPGRILGLSAWMVTPNPSLDGRTPAAALLDGDIDIVVAVATHHAA